MSSSRASRTAAPLSEARGGSRRARSNLTQAIARTVAVVISSTWHSVRVAGPRHPSAGRGDRVIEPEAEAGGTASTGRIAASEPTPHLWLPTVVGVGLLIFFVGPLAEMIRVPISSAARVATYAGLVVFVGIYLGAVVGDLVGRRPRHLAVAVFGLGALAVVITLFDGRAIWTVLFVATAAGAGRLARSTSAIAAIVLAAAIAAAADLWLGMEPFRALESSIEVLLVGLVVLGFSQTQRAAGKLTAAQAEIARAATDRERARIARDLHDLLGHSLSMVALKTELARKLLDRDPVQASAELAEIEDVVRTSLRDVRQAVAGYRQVDLDSELQGARVALVAAGFDVLIERPEHPLEPSVDALLGWVVREGATNIVRHSRGGQCSIEIAVTGDMTRLEILDDGPAPTDGLGSRPSVGTGRGLRGIRERVEQSGGTLEAGWRSAGGYALTVTVPRSEGAAAGGVA
jgi:two-component system, NarL family, sensor histidine kinase DesK